MKRQFVGRLVLLLLAIIVAGCGSGGIGAFSAEDAAVRAGTQSMSSDGGMVNQESIEIRQVRDEGDIKFVMFTFNRMKDSRPERCTMLFEARRTTMRTWVGGSGGGGCGGPVEVDGIAQDLPPIEAGGGASSGSDDPNGYTYADGLVNREDIVKVRVTWDDGSVFDADVINGSYLVLRDGQFKSRLIEGLDANGAVLETILWEPVPGKE